MSGWTEPEVGATVSLLAANGVPVDSWSVLSRSNRLVLALEPGGLIAKAVRSGDSPRLVREFAVAKHVAACHGPAAPPAPGTAVLFGERVAVSLWHPVEALAPPADTEICNAYLDLRRCLDSFPDALPDFQEAIRRAAGLLDTRELRHVSADDAARLRALYAAGFSRLAEFRWTDRLLHGDPHAGNVASTRQGLRWLDFEAVCTGPVEWDLSALPGCPDTFADYPALLATLVRLRCACVVVWCASKAQPDPAETEAIIHYLGIIRSAAWE